MPKMKKKIFGDFCPLGITPAGVIEFIWAYLCVCVCIGFVCAVRTIMSGFVCLMQRDGFTLVMFIIIATREMLVAHLLDTHIQSIRA